MKIVLDTCVLHGDPALRHDLLSRVIDSLYLVSGELVVPSPVLDELLSHHQKRLLDLRRMSQDVSRHAPKLDDGSDAHPFETREILQHLRRLEERIRAVSTVAPYPQVDHAEVVSRLLSGLKPFVNSSKNREKGYKDFLIWRTVTELVDAKANHVWFISENTRDFAINDGTSLHPDLAAELEHGRRSQATVRFSKSLHDFYERVLAPILEPIDDAHSDALKSALSPVNLEGHAEWLVTDNLQDSEFSVEAIGLPHEFEGPLFVSMFGARDFRVESIRRRASGPYYVTVQARVDVEVEGHAHKSEAFDLEERGDTSVTDWDWNDYYAEVSAWLELDALLSLTIDSDGSVVSGQVVRLSEVG